MGEEASITDYDVSGGDGDGRVLEWESGLPNVHDLPPLSQVLISAELASAFSITTEPHRSMTDVDRASRNTLLSLQGQSQQHLLKKLTDFNSSSDERGEEMVVQGEETVDLTREGSDSRKLRRVDSGGGGGGGGEEADSALRADDSSARTSNLKRNRLVWTPQLQKRFIDVVAHLGVKNAVPKTIMQLMNVEGLTRENVASHLQKYRLYVKRMKGSSNEGPSPSDPLHDSGGRGGSGNGQATVHFPVSYPPQMVPMPYPPPQMVLNPAGGGGHGYHHGLESRSHSYSMMMHPRDWSGNNFNSGSTYQHQYES